MAAIYSVLYTHDGSWMAENAGRKSQQEKNNSLSSQGGMNISRKCILFFFRLLIRSTWDLFIFLFSKTWVKKKGMQLNRHGMLS